MQISEMVSEELGGGSDDGDDEAGSNGAARGGFGGIPGYPMGASPGGVWDELSPEGLSAGTIMKRPRDASAIANKGALKQEFNPGAAPVGGRAWSTDPAQIWRKKIIYQETTHLLKRKKKKGSCPRPQVNRSRSESPTSRNLRPRPPCPRRRPRRCRRLRLSVLPVPDAADGRASPSSPPRPRRRRRPHLPPHPPESLPAVALPRIYSADSSSARRRGSNVQKSEEDTPRAG